MKLTRIALAAFAAAALAGSSDPALAGWPNDPAVNFRFAPSAGDQWGFLSTEDGAGGAFIIWNETNEIRAQHVTASGLVAPGWPANGITICAASSSQYASAIVPDGAGGFIAAWDDYRNGPVNDVYAQRIKADGTPSWTADGVPVCTAPGSQYSARLCSDLAGGAILSWNDARDYGTTDYDVYAQRLSAAGAPLWGTNGTAACALAAGQINPAVTSDGTVGGAYVAWRDHRSGSGDIYAVRLDASGLPRSGWTAGGTAVAAVAGDVSEVSIAPDGAFGVLLAWSDARGSSYDVYASRFAPSGVPSAGWPAGGAAITLDGNHQGEATIVSDGSGGAVVAWVDYRNAGADVYAQHVNGIGAATWAVSGMPLTLASGDQYLVRMVPDGAGGAVVGWQDTRAGFPPMVFAQRVTSGGSIAAGFAADGNAIATAHWVQGLAVCSDGAGGAILAWQHNGAPQQGYAQRIDRWGYLGAQPRIASVRDVPNDQGGRVKLSWDPSPLDRYPDNAISTYMVYRSVPPQSALAALAGGEAGLEGGSEGAAPARAGHATRAFVTTQLAGATIYWEHVADVSAAQLAGYSYIAETLQDSTAGSVPRTLFMVRAMDWSYGRSWTSDPDSGYSTDDLAPAPPAPFTGTYSAGATHLHWDPNGEADLAGYRLYRGTSAGFVPSPANLVASLPDTGYADGGAAGGYYKLTAVDSHGNESAASLLSPSATTAVDGGAEWTLALAPSTPNPSSGATACRFTLPAAGPVRFAIYDAAGRLVRVLADETMTAGEHALRWSGEREDGGRAPSGLYLARLSFAGRTLTQKLLRVR